MGKQRTPLWRAWHRMTSLYFWWLWERALQWTYTKCPCQPERQIYPAAPGTGWELDGLEGGERGKLLRTETNYLETRTNSQRAFPLLNARLDFSIYVVFHQLQAGCKHLRHILHIFYKCPCYTIVWSVIFVCCFGVSILLQYIMHNKGFEAINYILLSWSENHSIHNFRRSTRSINAL